MVGSEPYPSPTLDHGGKAIRWDSGAYPAPDMEMVDWIKSTSTVTKKGDIDEYAHLVWSRCLGLVWLTLQSLWESFPSMQFQLLPKIPQKMILNSTDKNESNTTYYASYIRGPFFVSKRGRGNIQGVARSREESNVLDSLNQILRYRSANQPIG